MRMPKRKYRLVAVRWEDAFSNMNRTPRKHHVFNTTVGWLLSEDRDGLLELSSEWSNEGTEWRGMTYVPVALVREVLDL